MFLGFEKIGKVTETRYDSIFVKIYPYSNYEAECPKRPSRPITNAYLKKLEQNRNEVSTYLDFFVNFKEVVLPVTGCSFFINDLLLLQDFFDDFKGWYILLKRKRVGERIIVGAYVSGHLIGYVPEPIAKANDFIFNGKNRIIVSVKGMLLVDDQSMFSKSQFEHSPEFSFLVSYTDSYEDWEKTLYWDPIPIIDLVLPSHDNEQHPLHSAWREDSPDKNASSKNLSIKSECYSKVSYEFQDSILKVLVDIVKMEEPIDWNMIVKQFGDLEKLYSDILEKWPVRLKKLGAKNYE